MKPLFISDRSESLKLFLEVRLQQLFPVQFFRFSTFGFTTDSTIENKSAKKPKAKASQNTFLTNAQNYIHNLTCLPKNDELTFSRKEQGKGSLESGRTRVPRPDDGSSIDDQLGFRERLLTSQCCSWIKLTFHEKSILTRQTRRKGNFHTCR